MPFCVALVIIYVYAVLMNFYWFDIKKNWCFGHVLDFS